MSRTAAEISEPLPHGTAVDRAETPRAESRATAERIAGLPEDTATADEREALEASAAEFEGGRFVTLDRLRHALHRPSR